MDVYQESDFRFFLEVERRRAERSGRSLLLILVDLAGIASPTARDAVAPRVLDVLATCVRESDFIGWYRRQTVAAAVLVQDRSHPTVETCGEIGRYVAALLNDRVPHDLVEVKVLQLEPRTDGHA